MWQAGRRTSAATPFAHSASLPASGARRQSNTPSSSPTQPNPCTHTVHSRSDARHPPPATRPAPRAPSPATRPPRPAPPALRQHPPCPQPHARVQRRALSHVRERGAKRQPVLEVRDGTAGSVVQHADNVTHAVSGAVRTSRAAAREGMATYGGRGRVGRVGWDGFGRSGRVTCTLVWMQSNPDAGTFPFNTSPAARREACLPTCLPPTLPPTPAHKSSSLPTHPSSAWYPYECGSHPGSRVSSTESVHSPTPM